MTASGSERAKQCISRELGLWSRHHRRRYVWRQPRFGAFRILVTEVLLVRTSAGAVEPVVAKLLARYANAGALAAARPRELTRYLRPLGLYRKRARALKQLGRVLSRAHAGRVPTAEAELLELPYVGRYVANAVRCFAFDERVPVVDVNVARVLRRVLGIGDSAIRLERDEELWRAARQALPQARWKEHNWALLDLGALVCRPRRPLCVHCPLKGLCWYASASFAALDGPRGRQQPIASKLLG